MHHSNQPLLAAWLNSANDIATDRTEPDRATVAVLREASRHLAGSRESAITEVIRAVEADDYGHSKLERLLKPFFSLPVATFFEKFPDEMLLRHLFELCSLYRSPKAYGEKLLAIRRSDQVKGLDLTTRVSLLKALIENQIDRSLFDDWQSIIIDGQSPDGVLHARSVDGWDGWRLMGTDKPCMTEWADIVSRIKDSPEDISLAVKVIRQIPETFPGLLPDPSAWKAELLTACGRAAIPELVVLQLPFLIARVLPCKFVMWKKYAGFLKVLLPDLNEKTTGQITEIEITDGDRGVVECFDAWIRFLERDRQRWSDSPESGVQECYNRLKDGVEFLRGFSKEKNDVAYLQAVFNAFEFMLLWPDAIGSGVLGDTATATNDTLKATFPGKQRLGEQISKIDEDVQRQLRKTPGVTSTKRPFQAVKMSLKA